MGITLKKIIVCHAYHHISALFSLCKANETTYCPRTVNSKLSQGISFMDSLNPRETKNLVNYHVPVWWNKLYKRFWSYHLQDRWDKWEEITPYDFLLAYTGALNISGLGL